MISPLQILCLIHSMCMNTYSCLFYVFIFLIKVYLYVLYRNYTIAVEVCLERELFSFWSIFLNIQSSHEQVWKSFIYCSSGCIFWRTSGTLHHQYNHSLPCFKLVRQRCQYNKNVWGHFSLIPPAILSWALCHPKTTLPSWEKFFLLPPGHGKPLPIRC